MSLINSTQILIPEAFRVWWDGVIQEDCGGRNGRSERNLSSRIAPERSGFSCYGKPGMGGWKPHWSICWQKFNRNGRNNFSQTLFRRLSQTSCFLLRYFLWIPTKRSTHLKVSHLFWALFYVFFHKRVDVYLHLLSLSCPLNFLLYQAFIFLLDSTILCLWLVSFLSA